MKIMEMMGTTNTARGRVVEVIVRVSSLQISADDHDNDV